MISISLAASAGTGPSHRAEYTTVASVENPLWGCAVKRRRFPVGVSPCVYRKPHPLFVVPTISFRLLYGLLIMGHGRRQGIWFGVTTHPTANLRRA